MAFVIIGGTAVNTVNIISDSLCTFPLFGHHNSYNCRNNNNNIYPTTAIFLIIIKRRAVHSHCTYYYYYIESIQTLTAISLGVTPRPRRPRRRQRHPSSPSQHSRVHKEKQNCDPPVVLLLLLLCGRGRSLTLGHVHKHNTGHIRIIILICRMGRMMTTTGKLVAFVSREGTTAAEDHLIISKRSV